ncbi:MAG: 2-dehydropantoate 2-reductase [Saccharospirillum sp.]|nr:2-dehydropantoate 2-reductase [Saccharospirillum sp.]
MRFLIVGAGGIGCYYGARLQNAGHEVTFLARGAHLEAMQQKGLSVHHPDFHFASPVTALDEAGLAANTRVSDFDVLLVCLKTQDTQPWLERMLPWLQSAPTPLLSVQNGVDNEPDIAAMVGAERTIGGLAVRIGGHIEAPGVVTVNGPAQIVMGAWPDNMKGTDWGDFLSRLDETLNAADIPSRVSDDIAREIWRKLMINAGVNPLSALTHLDTRSLCRHPLYGPAVRGLMVEAAQAGKADGVTLTDEDVTEMFDIIFSFDAIKTSMLVDKEKGRPLELDGICGAVIRRCEALNLPAPMTRLVYGLLS